MWQYIYEEEKTVSIRIVTDSTCDLPQEIVQENNISVVPLFINFGDQGYLDGVEISRQEFYTRLPKSDPHAHNGNTGRGCFLPNL